jgi:hypothetical protein
MFGGKKISFHIACLLYGSPKIGYLLKEIVEYLAEYYNTMSKVIKKIEREEDREISRH